MQLLFLHLSNYCQLDLQSPYHHLHRYHQYNRDYQAEALRELGLAEGQEQVRVR